MKQKKMKNELKQRKHRVIVLSFSAIVVLLILGLGLSMNRPSPTVSLSNQSIYDDFALTSTALIGQLTLNAINAERTQVADDIDKGAELALTATEIAERSVFFPLTQEALGIETNTPDPTLVAHATERAVTVEVAISQITQDAVFLTEVADGVSTFTPFDTVVEDWIVKIEEQLGFSHPELDIAVEKLLSQYQSDLKTLHFVELSPLFQSYESNNLDYIMVMLNFTSHSSYGSELLIFSVNDDFVELVFRHTGGEFVSDWTGLALADFNQNGGLNFAITYGNYGDCETSRLMVYELTADGLIDISPSIDEQWIAIYSTYNWVDYENIRAIQAYSSGGYMVKGYYPEECKPLDIGAIFKWNGDRYAKVD